MARRTETLLPYDWQSKPPTADTAAAVEAVLADTRRTQPQPKRGGR